MDVSVAQALSLVRRRLRDDPAEYLDGPRVAEISDKNRRTAEEVLAKVLPLIR